MKKITVLLAAYNGEKYLEQMIDSIIAQDHTDWHLVLSDDGSDDRTPEILKKYSESMPDQITLYRSGTRFGNPQQHFLHLIDRFHDTPYVMLCDQDDVWDEDKISVAVNALGMSQKPMIYCSSTRLVGEKVICKQS